jgi:hypothetical protein
MPIDISATKEWALREGNGSLTGRSRHEAGSFYRQYCFSLHYFPYVLKAEGSYILPDNACK